MAKEKKNTAFDAFAWLIYKEVEQYINKEHPEEFEILKQIEEQNKAEGSDNGH